MTFSRTCTSASSPTATRACGRPTTTSTTTRPGTSRRRRSARTSDRCSSTSRTRTTRTATTGRRSGYFGVMFLGHTTDPTGETAPDAGRDQHLRELLRRAVVRRGRRPDERFRAVRASLPEDDRARRRGAARLPNAHERRSVQGTSTRTARSIFQTAFVCGEGLEGMIAERVERPAHVRRRLVRPRRRPAYRGSTAAKRRCTDRRRTWPSIPAARNSKPDSCSSPAERRCGSTTTVRGKPISSSSAGTPMMTAQSSVPGSTVRRGRSTGSWERRRRRRS